MPSENRWSVFGALATAVSAVVVEVISSRTYRGVEDSLEVRLARLDERVKRLESLEEEGR